MSARFSAHRLNSPCSGDVIASLRQIPLLPTLKNNFGIFLFLGDPRFTPENSVLHLDPTPATSTLMSFSGKRSC